MSLPANQHPEPAEEEDISRAGVYHDEPAPSPRGKGKGKQKAENPFEDGEESSSEEEQLDKGEKGYPPTNDEDTESRRVAEVRSFTVMVVFTHWKILTRSCISFLYRIYDDGR